MKPAIGDKVTTYLGRPATIVDTDGNGRYKTASGLWWTWDGETLQEAEAPTEGPGSAGEGYAARVARLLPELAALPNWVAYKMVPSRKRPGKTDKKPVNPHTGKLAKADDSATWAAFDQAAAFLAQRPKLDGLGFQLGESPERKSGFVGVDLDNCIDGAGNLAPWAAEIVARLDSYTEVSPSGAGIRLFCRGGLPEGGRKKGDIEMYDYGRFLTVTGNVHGAPRPVRECTAELAAVHAAVFGERPAAGSNGSGPATATPTNLDDADLLEIACNASNGAAFDRLWRGGTGDHGGDHSAADLALCNHLAFYTGNDEKRIDRLFRQSGLMRDKWDERHFADGRTYGAATIEKAIANNTKVYDPARRAASANGTGPRFAVGQLVNVVIAGVLQNAAPCLVMDVHEPVNGEHGYTVAWPGEGQPKTYAESCLEAAGEEAPAARGAQAAPNQERLGDYGHARALSHLLAGQYRWVRQWKCWMGYRAGRWQQIDSSVIAKDASERLRAFYGPWVMAAPSPEEFKERAKYAAQTYRYNGIVAALSFLRGWDGFITEAEEWDTDPWLLNVADGTLDLRTGELLPHDPAHLLTKQAPVVYDPAATGPRWAEHIERFLPDAEIRRQVQRDLGTALVGATLEEALPIWYGLGANGKSTTARVVMSVLGDYGISAARDLLLRKKHEEHPTALADLAGRRLVFSAEADDGQRLNESLVKDLTGGDRKKARFMYGDFFEFEQTFSIVLFVNHKPVITGTDDGIWRRVRLVPWAYQIPKAERRPQEEVVSELLAEAPAILNWLLAGLRDWQAEPHWMAPVVRAATDEYRKEQDRLGGFLGECCKLSPHSTVAVADLYEAYTAYSVQTGEEAISKRAFGKNLRNRGLETKRGTGGVYTWHGIGLAK